MFHPSPIPILLIEQAAGTSINHFLLNSTQTSARSKFVIVRPQNFVHILLLIIVQCYYWQFDTLSPLSGMGRVVLLRPLFEDALSAICTLLGRCIFVILNSTATAKSSPPLISGWACGQVAGIDKQMEIGSRGRDKCK